MDLGTNENDLLACEMFSDMRPVGGQEYIMADLPCSQVAHAETASSLLTPGGCADVRAMSSCMLLTPMPPLICAFIVLGSKKEPPLLRYVW